MKNIDLINNIQLLLNSIYKDIQSGIILKNYFYKYLEDMDDSIVSLVKNTNYNRSLNKNIPLFRVSIDDRLRKAEKNLNSLDEYTVIPYTVKWIKNYLHNWWDELGFNYIKSFAINKYGIIECVFGIMLKEFSSLFSDTPESDKEKFQNKLNKLKEKGFQIVEVPTYGLVLKATERNKRLLVKEFRKIFKRFQIENIETLTEKQDSNGVFFIDKISLMINPKMIKELPVKNEGSKPSETTENFTKDELVVITKIIKEFNFSLIWFKTIIENNLSEIKNDIKTEIQEDIKTHMFLCESYFTRCCEVCNYKSVTSELYTKSHKKNKEKNLRIQKIEEKIMENKNTDTLSDIIQKVLQNTEDILSNELRLRITDFSLNQHCLSKVKLKFTFNELIFLESRKENVQVDKLAKKGIVFSENREEERNIKVLDNDSNRGLIVQELQKIIPSAEIVSIENEYVKGIPYICSVSIIVWNFSDFSKNKD